MAETRITPPFEGQQFTSHQQWVNKASSWLTCHPDYLNTEHGDAKGWRGNHFTALAFDSLGRRCRNGADMRRAEEEGAFPVWWVWPDQICELVQRGQLFGPYAHLNGHRALSEDSWTVEDDPIGNDVEYFSIPLFAKVDVTFPVTYGEPDASAYEAYGDELRALASKPIAFGLEAQGHIPAVEAALAEGADWQEIGRRIGWEGETAKTYYERHRARTANKPKDADHG